MKTELLTLTIGLCAVQFGYTQGSIDVDTDIQMGIAGSEHIKITDSGFSLHENPTTPLIYGDFATGNVGIGTTSPTYLLDVYGANPIIRATSSGNGREISIMPASSTIDSKNTDLLLNRLVNHNIRLVEGGGNVGVGVSVPAEKLHVSGNLQIDGISYLDYVRLVQNASTSKSAHFMELYSPNVSNSGAYIGIRFHQSGHYWHQMRVKSDGFHFTDGNSLTNYSIIKAEAYNTFSDGTHKMNIKAIQKPLEKAVALRGVTFDWKETGDPAIGFVAQEVEEVLPVLVRGEEGSKGVDYANITALLVEAIKELRLEKDQEINALKSEISALKKRMTIVNDRQGHTSEQ